MTQSEAQNFAWWQRGLIYQIYPRSFQDSNGDGIGDLNGIARRLDHLLDLGVDAIWISPIYPSPMADFGYDICDYCAVDPSFGTLSDFDRLLDEAHRRGLKLILDYVPNHCSDRHPWFVESRSSRTNPKRDWFIWRDPRLKGGPPNNWASEFGGSAWTFDEATGQYYYHAYLREQPDLNWRNRCVVEAMLDVLRFWFDRGVDGFRVDAIHHLIEDDSLDDNPPNPDWHEGMPPARRLLRDHTMDRPETHAAVVLMRKVAGSYPDERLLIGEAYLPIERMMAYYGAGLTGFQLPFNFHLIAVPWKPMAVAALIEAYEGALPKGGWPNWVMGNHDKPRIVSRLGAAQARIAAMLLLTLRGTPTIYQGEEIGMRDVAIPPEMVRDPFERNVPGMGRDPERTPMQWTSGKNAGFSTGTPWLPIGTEFETVNVAAQSTDPRSMLALYRALLALRRREDALSVGAYAAIAATEAVLAYERRHDRRRLLIVLNLTGEPAGLPWTGGRGEFLLSSALDRSGDLIEDKVLLRADEGVVICVY